MTFFARTSFKGFARTSFKGGRQHLGLDVAEFPSPVTSVVAVLSTFVVAVLSTFVVAVLSTFVVALSFETLPHRATLLTRSDRLSVLPPRPHSSRDNSCALATRPVGVAHSPHFCCSPIDVGAPVELKRMLSPF
jgi:hypothetical protein